MVHGLLRPPGIYLLMIATLASYFLGPSIRYLSSSLSRNMSTVKHLGQEQAQNIDIELFNEYKYSIDQLMELAGLAVAIAVSKSYPEKGALLVVCGPGNNGGDGLVAARHLALFGFTPSVVYPKQPDRHPFNSLLHQVRGMGIPVSSEMPSDLDSYTCIVDAVFGFSFKGSLRAPFDTIIPVLAETKTPVASVDVPSGWDVEHGCTSLDYPALQPDILVSLTAPKLCARQFTGRHHWLGGRFVPPSLAAKYELQLPEYPDAEQVVLL